MKTPFLADAALPALGTLDGHTIATATRPETSDDEPPRVAAIDHGSSSPFLAGGALDVEGDVVGYSRVTRAAPETTDDDPGYR